MPTWVDPETPPRGTVIVTGGRGEGEAVYRRLSRRLAFDGYRVGVVTPHGGAGGHDQEAVRAVRALIAAADPALPVVLVGSDAGAATVVGAAKDASVAGVVLAGVLTAEVRAAEAAEGAGSWDDELDVRSACPLHRGVLAGEGGVVAGALGTRGGVLDPPALGALAVPVLAVHGDRDRVTPPEEAEALFVHARDAETVLVVDGRHDILNDVSHRSVAAEIVQFLERLRIPGAEPILRRRDAVGSDLVDRVG